MIDFSQQIIGWYNANKRDLPWRNTIDPYRIWVSEIILQQTRINQGLNYYHRFILRFSDIHSLAEADEQEVLTIWKGLGYYSRARNMHKTAQTVVEVYKGEFPVSYHELLKLKGIGRYTAAAIASICNQQAYPVVDGNAIRVISRVFGIDAPIGSASSFKQVWDKSAGLIANNDPGTYNQAVMEFGAIYCKPTNPDCENCIFSQNCYAHRHKITDLLPVKQKKTEKKERWFNYFYAPLDNNSLLMKKRKHSDIWKNLWELPLIESDHLLTSEEVRNHEIFESPAGKRTIQVTDTQDFRHILTHQIIYARFFEIQGLDKSILIESAGCEPIDLAMLSKLPMSRLTERYLATKLGIG